MKKIILLLTHLITTANFFAQNYCGTPALTNIENTQITEKSRERSSNLSYILKIYFHVIRTTSGTGGVSTANVSNAYNILNNDFNTHGIFFYWDGTIDYIDNSTTYYNAPNTNIYSINTHTNGIDIYLYPSSSIKSEGLANGIGVSSEFYISGSYKGIPLCNTHIISHEMGHVLNLWHTHHGTYNNSSENGNDPNHCQELVNGSNSSTCGDYVDDTPADPLLSELVISNCTYTGNERDANNQLYQPDVNLIMSYAPPSCMTYFSLKQGERMREAIGTLQHLILAQHPTTFDGPEYICNSSTGTYSINGLPNSYSVNWYLSDGFGSTAPTLYSSNNACTITNQLNKSYMGLLNASIYYNGYLLRTLQKRIIAYADFWGTYGNGVAFGPNSPAWIANGSTLTLQSPNLVRKNVSYSSSGATPSGWQHISSQGKLIVSYPSGTSTTPIIVNIQNDPNSATCDPNYQFIILPTSLLPHHSLIVTTRSDRIDIAIIFENTLTNYNNRIFVKEHKEWLVEVYNTTHGGKMYSGKSASTSCSINTSKWSPGIYLVQVTNNDEKLSEKIVIK